MDNFRIVPILNAGSYIRCPKFCRILTKFEVSRHIFIQAPPISNFTEIRSVRATLRRADRWTDAQTKGRETTNSDCILITNLMHQLLFIHKIIFSSTCFDPQVLIFRRIQLYTCSIWYCHSL